MTPETAAQTLRREAAHSIGRARQMDAAYDYYGHNGGDPMRVKAEALQMGADALDAHGPGKPCGCTDDPNAPDGLGAECEDHRVCREALMAACARSQAQVDAIRAFLAKWDEAEPKINGAIGIATVHGIPYTGPSLKDELDVLRALLTAPPAECAKP